MGITSRGGKALMIYVLYIKNHFDKKWHLVKGFSQFRSELYGWLENNWIQFRGGKVPVIEAEIYYQRKVEKEDFS